MDKLLDQRYQAAHEAGQSRACWHHSKRLLLFAVIDKEINDKSVLANLLRTDFGG